MTQALDAERLGQIRDNAAFAVGEFGALAESSFSYDAESVAWVEGFIERQRGRQSEGGTPQGLIAVIGSYLGEAIIAAAGGAWIEDDAGGIGVRFPNGDTAYPFTKVRKQFEQGLQSGESIASFYNVSVNFVATGKLHEEAAGSGEAR
ncbi:MAG: hypothetical protein AB7S70_05915 [Hyphomicrobium sp.]|uniref:hypothetical protein n=1 Tax=Hyphomicrobium sp. TaxID=82 RepID=UPI003D12194C